MGCMKVHTAPKRREDPSAVVVFLSDKIVESILCERQRPYSALLDEVCRMNFLGERSLKYAPAPESSQPRPRSSSLKKSAAEVLRRAL